jgi:putative DNA primase/helicase
MTEIAVPELKPREGYFPNFSKLTNSYEHHLTDTGNADLFLEYCGDRVLYSHQYGRFYVWNGVQWVMDEDGRAVQMAKEAIDYMAECARALTDSDRKTKILRHSQKSESRGSLVSMVELSKCEIPFPLENMNRDPRLFNVSSGVINLKSGEVVPHDKELFITKSSPVKHDPSAACPLWLKFLDDIFNGDQVLIEFIQRAVGYSLTAEVSEQVFFFLYGTGANGKSTFLNTIMSLAGDYGRQMDPHLLISQNASTHPTGISDLHGVRFASTVEIEEGKRFAEVVVKQLTGGDLITARRMHQDFFTFAPTHKIWLSANHKPSIRGTDHAIWRRVRLIPFTVCFGPADRDPKMGEKLLAELPGILNWCIAGARNWYANGLAAPEVVTVATEAYRTEMDTLAAFVKEYCVLVPGASIASKDLYSKYKEWAEESGEHALSHKMFSMRIIERYGLDTATSHAGARRFVGIGLAQSESVI